MLPEAIVAAPEAHCNLLGGDAMAQNEFGKPPVVQPMVSTIKAGQRIEHIAPPNRLSILRIRTR